MKRTSTARSADVKREFRPRRDLIRRRLAEFSAVPPSEYFYELAYCLLTPQSSARNAGKVVEQLKAEHFLENGRDPAALLGRKDHYIRFHNTKARRLREARSRFPEIRATLADSRNSRRLRAWLVQNVKGLGWKEASHFLRNIGHRNLAILDRHILASLKRHGVIRRIPATLTAKRYLAIEQQFLRFAERIGISIDELDLLFWSRATGVILK